MQPDPFTTLLRDYLLPSVPGATLKAMIASHADGEVRAQDMAGILASNPAYENWIVSQKILSKKVDSWKEESAERPDQLQMLSKRVLGLMGKTATRNLVTCLRLTRMTQASVVPRKKDQRVDVEPSKMIPFALKAESLCESKSWVFPEMAFIGGLHYDWLASIFSAQKLSKEVTKSLEDVFNQGLLLAQYSYLLSLDLKSVKHQKMILAGALILPLGSILGQVCFPKGELPAPWCNEELTSIYAVAFEILKDVAPALRFAREPWMLRGVDADLELCATLWSIALSAIKKEKLKPGDSLGLDPFQRDWLKRMRLQEAKLVKAFAELGAEA